MAYILAKPSSNKSKLHYLVESYREDGKSKRRTIYSMGKHASLNSILRDLKQQELEYTMKYHKLLNERNVLKEFAETLYGRLGATYMDNKYVEGLSKLFYRRHFIRKDIRKVEGYKKQFPNL